MDWAVALSRRQGLAPRAERLTETQRQCLRLTYQHKTSKEIAPLLGLSPHSVDAHIRIAMKVLGVDGRREAALALNDIETAHPARRKPPNVQYETAGPAVHAHASEGLTPVWTYPPDRSSMGASEEQSRNNWAMNTPVEQSGFTGAVPEPEFKDGIARIASWINLVDLSAKKKVLIVMLTALLSAMAFATIVSGFAALSLLVTDEGSAE
jgi:DNA-binding CsgD family transcriptional regulator